jgi:hypothetical protein
VIISWFNAVIWRPEFNDYVEELWGIADALNMSRLEVFALNCADDIDLYTRTPNGSWFAPSKHLASTRASLKQVPPIPLSSPSTGLLPPIPSSPMRISAPTPCCPALCFGDTTRTRAWTSTCLMPAQPTSSTSPTRKQEFATLRAPPDPHPQTHRRPQPPRHVNTSDTDTLTQDSSAETRGVGTV